LLVGLDLIPSSEHLPKLYFYINSYRKIQMSSLQTQSKDILNPQTLIIHKGKLTPVNGLFSFLHFYIQSKRETPPVVDP
jgi:hypothetical protein